MALTTLARVKTYGGLGSHGDDAVLTDLLDAASAAVEQYLDRSLATATHTAVLDGNGAALLPLPQYPITAVTTLRVNGRALPQSSGYGVSGFFIYGPNKNALALRGDERFPVGMGNVEVVFTAGYTDIPDDIQQAVCEMVVHRYKERDWLGYQSKSLAGETVSFQTAALSPNVRFLLDPYRAVVPV